MEEDLEANRCRVQCQKFGSVLCVVFELLRGIPGVPSKVSLLSCMAKADKITKYGRPFLMSFK